MKFVKVKMQWALNKTFYNRPMPKSSNNWAKTSIPRIQSNDFAVFRKNKPIVNLHIDKSETAFRSTSTREVKNMNNNKFISYKNTGREADDMYKKSEFLRKSSVSNMIESKTKNAWLFVSSNYKNLYFNFHLPIMSTIE